MRKVLVTLLVLVILGGGGMGAYRWYQNNNQRTQFRTVSMERGDLLATINATGTVEPEEVIDVGAQVVGQIKSFGRDPRDSSRLIDFGSPVEEGTVLAQIDESVYASQVEQAKANLKRAEADLQQLKAKLHQTERDWRRAEKMRPTKAIAEVDYDTALAVYETAQSALAVGEAAVDQAKASLKQAEISLGYCTIRSPVKGVIVDRRVNVGQTVVSSLNAPSLFLLAKDLRRLQIWASVNEADIGNIHPGQKVTFTVDAFPNEKFQGIVAPDQPRLNATMTQNVVTYTVVVNTDNANGKLKPYLTANLDFEVDRHNNVLLVPNAALRWQPRPQQVVPEARDEYLQSLRKRSSGLTDGQAAAPGMSPGTPAAKGVAPGSAGNVAPPKEREHHDRGRLWVEDDGYVRPVKVHIGLTDGVHTEILGSELKEGTPVVTGEARANGEGSSSNPFTPQMFGGKKGQ
jgi:HlyD family secretion protein